MLGDEGTEALVQRCMRAGVLRLLSLLGRCLAAAAHPPLHTGPPLGQGVSRPLAQQALGHQRHQTKVTDLGRSQLGVAVSEQDVLQLQVAVDDLRVA
ncbi:hypothetical protein V8C86DRAFT_2877975 [Haematococcus lacustris]